MIPVPRSFEDELRFFCEVSAVKLQDDYLPRLRKSLAVVPPEKIWEQSGAAVNSIGMLLAHMEGNLRQWTIVALGRAPDTRDRDVEFSPQADRSGHELLEDVAATVDEACRVIRTATRESLLSATKVQIYEVTGIEAVYHAVEHFSYHLGQIIQEAKRISGKGLNLYPF